MRSGREAHEPKRDAAVIYPRSCKRCGGAVQVDFGDKADDPARCVNCGDRPQPRPLPYLTPASRGQRTPVAGPSQAALDLQAEVEEQDRRERLERGRRLAAEFRALYSQGVTVKDAAKRLGVSARSLHRWLKAAK